MEARTKRATQLRRLREADAALEAAESDLREPLERLRTVVNEHEATLRESADRRVAYLKARLQYQRMEGIGSRLGTSFVKDGRRYSHRAGVEAVRSAIECAIAACEDLQLAAVADVQGELDAIWASVPWARTNEFAPEP